MTLKKRIIKSQLLIIFILIFVSCEEDKIPAIFSPNETGNPAPVITAVDPSDYGLISLTEIKITGDNFSSSMDSLQVNTVYIGKEKAKVLSASKTEIRAMATPTPGESLTIKVIVPGAFQIAEYAPFQLKNVKEGVGIKANDNTYYAIAVDSDENVYGFIKQSGSVGLIHKFTSNGSTIDIGTVDSPIATDMKVGPSGYLYILNGLDKFYRIKIADGVSEEFVILPERVSFFDFDQNHNIYTAGRNKGIIVTDIDGSEGRLVGDFKDYNIYSIKVFEGEIYIAARYSGANTSLPQEGIYKASITSSTGDLGETTAVFDWDNAGDHSGSAMKSITIDENGTILVGTNNNDNPIISIKQNGSTEVLYPDDLLSSVFQIVYGPGEYIYQNRKTSDMDTYTIYKILTQNQGAPYFGRE